MNHGNEFLFPELSVEKLDYYLVRRSIFNAVLRALPRFSGVLIDVGCGNAPYKSLLLSEASNIELYVGLDIVGDSYDPPDIYWDEHIMPFRSRSTSCAFATEVLEHCPDPQSILAEIYRVLKPGGLFFFTVPFIWPLHDVPNDHYRYTPFSLRRYLKTIGFEHIEFNAMGGWDASLAQMVGLWARRRPMPSKFRLLISLFALPIMKFLLRLDKPSIDFEEGSMITGLSGIAFKPVQ